MLFANCEPTYQSRQEALKKEQEYLSQIYDIDPHFAERCGYKRWGRQSPLIKLLLCIQALDCKEEGEGQVQGRDTWSTQPTR